MTDDRRSTTAPKRSRTRAASAPRAATRARTRSLPGRPGEDDTPLGDTDQHSQVPTPPRTGRWTPQRRAAGRGFGRSRRPAVRRLVACPLTTPRRIDRRRIKELTDREERALNERTQASRAMYDRARNVLSGGVASSYQLRDPWPIYLERGEGPRVWDVDGNELFDFHNGFGSMVQGHAHPAIGARGERSATPRARTSRRRPRTASGSPRSSRAASGCRAGATRTPARSRRWTRSGSRAPTPGATR